MEISENPKPVVGYSDKLSAQPGEQVSFMVSSDIPKYHADIVRLFHGAPESHGPGHKEKLVQTLGDYAGKTQVIPLGSYAEVPKNELFSVSSFTLQTWIAPTIPKKGMQGILTCWNGDGGYGLFIDESGHLVLMIKDEQGKTEKLTCEKVVQVPNWYFVACSFDEKTREARLVQENISSWPSRDSETVKRTFGLGKPRCSSSFLIAAYWGRVDSSGAVVGHFNGKIDAPRLFSRALDKEQISALMGGLPPNAFVDDLIASWDFSLDISSNRVTDGSPHFLHGRTVNSPKRAVTGHNWTGREANFGASPQEYGGIHFHDDDLDDCGWDVGFRYTVPEDMKSGIYAAKLSAGPHKDYVPFYVRPAKGGDRAKIAFLAPTLSYFAYGDFHSTENVMFEDFKYPVLAEDRYVVKEKLHSLYDKHSDGSGVCYFSRLKPNMTIRPDHISSGTAAGKGGIRDFSGDLCLVDWLEVKGFQYDVITDEDLHAEGVGLLSSYNVIMTGAHPEYWTERMLDALELYLKRGGRLMYLGGNGFYWVTSIDPNRPHIIEVRRWGGTQSWKSLPGEYYHSSTGELGGVWRNRGRPPQKLAGIGFSAQGFDTNSVYKRLPDSFDPRAAFIFEGVGKDEVIGDFDNLGQKYGAAGDELDRADQSLGTPSHALIVATAKDTFTDYYQAVVEEVDIADSKQGGTVSPLVRADMVYFEGPNGGAVFSVGSIAWIGSLFYNSYENNVSRITENVLRRFSSDKETG